MTVEVVVLLDGKWCALAQTAVAEMRAVGIKAPLAAVYSGKKGEIDRFLADLERGA